MGWFFRKSVGFGPFRLNLSKSGVGYSVGVRGARIGSGPRGNYIRLGRGGVYYQKYLNPSPSSGRPSVVTQPTRHVADSAYIATADASELFDSTSEHLLREIQAKSSSTRLAPFAVLLSVGLELGLLVAKAPNWLTISIIPILVFVHYCLAREDYERRLVVLNYDLDADMRKEYGSLLSGMSEFASSSAIWRVTSLTRFVNRKYHGGASTTLDRHRISLRLSTPPSVETDLAVWSLPLGNQLLYLFPDRILVYQGREIGAIAYEDLSIVAGQTRFVEDGAVPPDSQVVDHTWQYVNKDGGPDRRFSNNRRLPVVLYAQLVLQSRSGLNIALESSDVRKAAVLKAVLEYYSLCRKKDS